MNLSESVEKRFSYRHFERSEKSSVSVECGTSCLDFSFHSK